MLSLSFHSATVLSPSITASVWAERASANGDGVIVRMSTGRPPCSCPRIHNAAYSPETVGHYATLLPAKRPTADEEYRSRPVRRHPGQRLSNHRGVRLAACPALRRAAWE